MNSAILLQATSKNVVITYTSSLFGTPIPVTGTGIADMLSIDDITDNAVMEIGTDGTPSVHIKPVLVTGKLTLQPMSVALTAFRTVMTQQNLIGAPFPGILNITSPTSQWNVTFPTFIVTSAFKGFELAEKQKDVVISWKSTLPDATVLGNLVSVGLAIGGLV